MSLNQCYSFFANRPYLTGGIAGMAVYTAGLFTSPAVIQFAASIAGMLTGFMGLTTAIYAGIAISAGLSIFAGILAAMAYTKFMAKPVDSQLQKTHVDSLDLDDMRSRSPSH